MKHLFSPASRHPVHLTALTVAVLLLLSILTGCPGPSETADLHLSLEQYARGSRTFNPDTPLSVSYYELEGLGPDAHSFLVTADSSFVTIPELLVGDWHIEVIGYSSAGVGLVHGESIIALTNSEQTGVISMTEFYGTGGASITISWDSSQTIDPTLHTYLLPCGSTETPQELTADTASEGIYTYTLSDLASGAYRVTSELFSDGVRIAGSADILRIVDGQITDGSLSMVFNDLLLGLDITIVDNSVTPIEGSITGIPMTLAANTPVPVTFTPSPDSLQSGLTCTWYVDGIQEAVGNPVNLTFGIGKHQLDVVVTADNMGSPGSSSLALDVRSEVLPGSLVLYRAYTDGLDQEYLLDGISDLEVLPDGLIIGASSISDAVQSYTITGGDLQIEQTFIADGTQYLLDGADSITASDDGNHIAVYSSNSNTLSIFSHVNGSDLLTLSQTILCTGSNSNGDYAFTNIGGIAFNADGSLFTAVDRDSKIIIDFERSGTTYSFLQNTLFASNPEFADCRSIDLGCTDSTVAATSAASNSLVIMSRDGQNDLSINYIIDSGSAVGLTDVHQLGFIQNDTMIVLSSNTISAFTYDQPPVGPWSPSQTSYLNPTTIPVAFSPKDFTADASGERLYAVSSTGMGIISFDYNTVSDQLTYDDFVSTDTIKPEICNLSSDGTHLIIGSGTHDTLLLYQIAPAN
ncbi:MAG: hypothetical protein K9M84_11145 [Spirochaetia bacterium]|nr:hypothetical protein [Spirochaetia bacterium]